MAMLKKTFLAAVACSSIAFAASAFAQASGAAGGGAASAGAGGMAGASASTTATAGTTGSPGATSSITSTPAGTTNTGVNSTLNSNMATSRSNTMANNSTTLGTNNALGTNNSPGKNNNTLSTNNTLSGGTSLGTNGVNTNNTLAQNTLGVNAGPGVTNNLGTRGPAGSTSVSSAQAATPGAGIVPNGAPALTTGSGSSTKTLGGNGVVKQRQTARANISHARMMAAERARQRRVAANLEKHREMRIRHEATIAGRNHVAGISSHTTFAGLNLGNTATPVRDLGVRAMARVNARERNITSELNHAELHGATGQTAMLNNNERSMTAQLNMEQVNHAG